MSAPTATRTCPSWCVSPHDQDEGDTFHYQQTAPVPYVFGTVNVSAFIHRDRPGVCLEDYELSPTQARNLAAKLVAEADLVEASAR